MIMILVKYKTFLTFFNIFLNMSEGISRSREELSRRWHS